MPESPSPTALALDRLGATSLRATSMESVLQTVADLSRSVLPGSPEASVTVVDTRRRFTVAASGDLARELDEVQYSQGVGPCLHAAASGELTEIADTRFEERWPEYARRAAAHGSLSVLSVPLLIDQDVSGALNLHAREPDAFSGQTRAAAQRLAAYAAVAVGLMSDYQEADTRARHLEVALESRAVIDQAKGILMERDRVTADQAFQRLTEVSSRTNVKVRDVAEHLVRTGVLGDPPRT
ncbi:GAF and ANTAR domain-containing protein [Modestobacter marinus]|uniref:ANTAR domain-containing protein n=1 Tax=Modestobacter marinus TaxID=477641 RepID=A0A846LT09_9ACTN|nr:GAF and ANTAR domain-containing protein [Modestobacter marinus]NIH65600.1 GAF domain-containing protein [Modestobacter marinus]GGL65695.1 ANTAR domain-containing protein [Modestobacter marinus]